MKWSWKLGEVQGIGIYMHATFLILVGWVALVYWMQQETVAAALEGVAFILALFSCIVLHELGHALTAKRYGVQTRDITLLPIGGLARLQRMPDEPKHELWVALAGPAVNVVIAAALFGWLRLTGTMQEFAQAIMIEGPFLQRLMLVNIFLVVFNMIPAFPMDGGRVLRALLAMRMDYVRATQIASTFGQGIAFLFGFIGLFANPFLLFIALFVWMGATQEAGMAQIEAVLSGVPVERVMLTEFRSLSASDSLSKAVEFTLSGSQQDFPVTDNDEVVGILTQASLVKALTEKGTDAPVEKVMQRDFETADSSEMMEKAFQRLQSSGSRALPVMRKGQLVGLLTRENLGEFLSIQYALKQNNGGKASKPAAPLPMES